MRLPHFFIDRPVFAAVVSILIILFGAIAYPDPAGRAISGDRAADGDRHRHLSGRHGRDPRRHRRRRRSRSRSTASRTCSTCPRQSHRRRHAHHHHHLRSWAPTSTRPRCWCRTAWPRPQPQLPAEVQQIGVVTRRSPRRTSCCGRTLSRRTTAARQQYLSQLRDLQLVDRLSRLPGVGDVNVFGARDYSMRIWIDPDRAAAAQSHGRRHRRRDPGAKRRRWPPAPSARRRSTAAAPPSSSASRRKAACRRRRNSATSS